MTAPRDVKVDLPELPKGSGYRPFADWPVQVSYTADQMRDYARCALADVEAEVRGLSASLSDAFDLLRDHEAALAAATARCDAAEALLVRIRDDRSWRTNDNALWPDICAALAGKGAGS